MTPLFSIITPCYNSSLTLETTFGSLLRQTIEDFEWILVDDASNDNGKTRELIDKIKNEAPFSVTVCLLEKNAFGSKSVFTGCSVAKGKYVAVLDHDDQLTPNALFTVKKYIETYDTDDHIAGVCGRCINESGVLIGKKFKSDYFLANEGEIRFKLGITAELFQFSKIEIIKPLFKLMEPGYKNGFVWARISKNFQYLYVNDVLRIYDTALPTSYSNTKSYHSKYPQARAESTKDILICHRPYLMFNLRYSSLILGSYIRNSISANMNLNTMMNGFDMVLKLWCFVLYPIAFIKAKGYLHKIK